MQMTKTISILEHKLSSKRILLNSLLIKAAYFAYQFVPFINNRTHQIVMSIQYLHEDFMSIMTLKISCPYV